MVSERPGAGQTGAGQPRAEQRRREPRAALDLARHIVGRLAGSQPGLLVSDGVDLAPALEQQVFFALRDGVPARRLVGLRSLALMVGAAAWSLRPIWRGPPAHGTRRPILALIRGDRHADLLAPVMRELDSRGGPPVVMARVGQAAGSDASSVAGQPRLADLMTPRRAARAAFWWLGAGRRATRTALPDELAPGEAAAVARVVREHLPRLALGAAGILSATDRLRPSLLVTFDEAGSWGRLLVAAGRRLGLPVVDLPHAEIADSLVLEGAGYDRLAVIGPLSAARARAAGIPAARIVETGLALHDVLVERASARATIAPGAGGGPRRIVFAAQYPTPRLPEASLVEGLRALVVGAAVIGPVEIVARPHPIGPAGFVERCLARIAVPAGVTVTVARAGDLAGLLGEAWALATVSSQSVLEAALAGVPAIAVQPPGTVYDAPPPGTALVATTTDEVADQLRQLEDAAAYGAVVRRHRESLEEHLGPLDARATERTASLLLSAMGAGEGS